MPGRCRVRAILISVSVAPGLRCFGADAGNVSATHYPAHTARFLALLPRRLEVFPECHRAVLKSTMRADHRARHEAAAAGYGRSYRTCVVRQPATMTLGRQVLISRAQCLSMLAKLRLPLLAGFSGMSAIGAAQSEHRTNCRSELSGTSCGHVLRRVTSVAFTVQAFRPCAARS